VPLGEFIIDSDSALVSYLDTAGRCQLYAEIRASVEILAFSAPKDMAETFPEGDHPSLLILLDCQPHRITLPSGAHQKVSEKHLAKGDDAAKDAGAATPNPGYAPSREPLN
ncbi:unnamed protein product, partial [Polarella glacialis]